MRRRLVIEFGEADDPAASAGIQVGHVEGDGIELTPVEDRALGIGEFGGAVGLHGAG